MAGNLGLVELGGERRLDLVDQALVPLAQHLEPLDHRRVGLGVQPAKGMVLELLAQPLHAHAPGERRIDVHGLLGDDLALAGLHMLERAHIVQAVGELDEQHADVARDGEQELAEILGLLGLLGDEVELLDLGETVDERADLAPEHARRSRSRVVSVSSIVSCRSAVAMVASSSRISARMVATSSGWEKKRAPEARF